MDISFGKMEQQTEQDLNWLFCQSDADLGNKSNFTVVESIGTIGKAAYHDHFNESIMEAISKKRSLEKIFFSLSQQDQNILYLMFGEKPLLSYSPNLRRQYGSYAPIIFYLYTKETKDKNILSDRKMQAIKLYKQAITNYHEKKLNNDANI